VPRSPVPMVSTAAPSKPHTRALAHALIIHPSPSFRHAVRCGAWPRAPVRERLLRRTCGFHRGSGLPDLVHLAPWKHGQRRESKLVEGEMACSASICLLTGNLRRGRSIRSVTIGFFPLLGEPLHPSPALTNAPWGRPPGRLSRPYLALDNPGADSHDLSPADRPVPRHHPSDAARSLRRPIRTLDYRAHTTRGWPS
jgi:hypothetical protein